MRFFAGLRAALCTEKMTAMSSQNDECPRTLVCLVFLSLLPSASSWCWRRLKLWTEPWSVQRNINVEEEATQVGGGKGLNSLSVQAPTRRRARYRAIFTTTAFATGHAYNGTWPAIEKKTAVALRHLAGHCCKRSIAILTPLRACESSEYCQSREGQKKQ